MSRGTTTLTDIGYDSHGNTTSFANGGSTTYLGWDAADRNLTARTTGSDPADISYVRDAANRITRRAARQGDTVSDVLYSYTSSTDDADFTLSADKRLVTRTVNLPGGVLYTLHLGDNAAPQSWDVPSNRGNIAFTCDGAGKQIHGLRTYTPYGEPLDTNKTSAPDAIPDNQPGQMDYGWLGQYQRAFEHAGSLALIQMGARPYSPILGRSLSVDPVEGGSANDYDYVFADPINKTDTAGTSAISGWWNGIRDTGWFKDTANTLFTASVGKLTRLACRGLWSYLVAVPSGIVVNHVGGCYIQAGFRFSAGSCYFSGVSRSDKMKQWLDEFSVVLRVLLGVSGGMGGGDNGG
ncbi:RHS repeat-associated core domain-containing protein [Amycolatopsis sp. NPDC051716]|jgi:RHS repeat-associated protein|uniref:RHS repeat-associated core domain-containing protein n=1 Tax=Amycolatopsis sp. NPDC051716 TaxID=3155804 RepID=UPI0034370CBA